MSQPRWISSSCLGGLPRKILKLYPSLVGRDRLVMSVKGRRVCHIFALLELNISDPATRTFPLTVPFYYKPSFHCFWNKLGSCQGKNLLPHSSHLCWMHLLPPSRERLIGSGLSESKRLLKEILFYHHRGSALLVKNKKSGKHPSSQNQDSKS